MIETGKRPTVQVYAGSFTRDISLASGDQTVTGLGFKPSAVIFLANQAGSTKMSIGIDNTSSGAYCIRDDNPVSAGTYNVGSGYSIQLKEAAPDVYIGAISAVSNDGFTVTWTKGGNPSGTATIMYLAFR